MICLFLVLSTAGGYAFVVEGHLLGAFLGVLFVMCIFLFAFNALKYKINIFIIDEKGVRVRNVFAEIIAVSWQDVKDIYVYQFNGIEKIRIPYNINRKGARKYRKYGKYNIGGTVVFIPRKIPTKWIFIDDGRGDNGENIFEYLVPLEEGAIIRMKYNKNVFEAIKKEYQKDMIEKAIEISEM